jgi:hypothetical protein
MASKTDGGVLVTGISWFDALSIKYSITDMSSVFNTTNVRFQNYYKVVFDPSIDVKEVAADFKIQNGVVIAEPNYIWVLYRRFFENQVKMSLESTCLTS